MFLHHHVAVVAFSLACCSPALAVPLDAPAAIPSAVAEASSPPEHRAGSQGEQATSSDTSIAAKVAGLRKIDGLVPIYWDERAGRMWMEIGRFGTELLYQVSLPAGVGSNPIGLDRGQMGDSALVVFERVGPKVLMIQPNYRYRALSQDAAERRAVEQSFARSVLWGFKVEAAEGGRVLVDATAFFLRDAHGVVDCLRQSKQGGYRLDDSRSAFYFERTKGFPRNTEVETTLTFTTEEDPGNLVSEVTPTPSAVTVREHHSFVELPALDGGYRPRRLDPRVSSFGITFNDYATPISAPIEKRWIARHRLVKKDPAAAVSDPVAPIVYYVDNGAPEPIRSALVEGASWWNEAFEAAGFRGAFQVKVLPEEADPMDLRYNMINWVHRSSRGWSYGGSVVDPRTGEILKGNVTLGSLRIRQDYMLGSGMVPQSAESAATPDMHADHFACDFGALPELDYLADLDPASDAVAMSLARIRQLSAHETGHTLGFAHNFAASTYGRASVMDYPAPAVGVKDGHLDLSDAYGTGIGAFDKFSVTYAYAQFAPGADEERELQKIVAGGIAGGMLFISDEDARPAGAAHPLASLWDNGADPVATLRHEMEVRRVGLSQFGLGSIPDGTPLSMLEAKLLPLYLHHRYQLQAAVKTVGGLSYTLLGEDGGQTAAHSGGRHRAGRPAARSAAGRARHDQGGRAAAARSNPGPDPAARVRLRRAPGRVVRETHGPRLRPNRGGHHCRRPRGVGAAPARTRGAAHRVPLAQRSEPRLRGSGEGAASPDVVLPGAGSAEGRPRARGPSGRAGSRRDAVDGPGVEPRCGTVGPRRRERTIAGASGCRRVPRGRAAGRRPRHAGRPPEGDRGEHRPVPGAARRALQEDQPAADSARRSDRRTDQVVKPVAAD